MCVWQELLTAATGLNTSLIEDVKARRRAGQLTSGHDVSDIKALSSPNFTVIQALVALLAHNAACFSTLNRVSPPPQKCNSCVLFSKNTLYIVSID